MLFRTRRLLSITALVLVLLMLTPYAIGYRIAFSDVVVTSGWLLFAVVVFLSSYNLRKKLTYPPLLKSSTWLQMHIYLGIAAMVIFLFHTSGKVPTGHLDIALYALFTLMVASGLFGFYLTRTIPTTLSSRGNEVIFERIPLFRRQIKDRVEQIILQSIEQSASSILAEFYESYLMYFLSGPRNVLLHLVRSERTSYRLRHELRESDRYLNEQDKVLAAELDDLIKLKDDLDFHYARQGLLKLWLFFHIPMTLVLLIFLVAHIVLIYAFTYGGS